MLPEMDKNSHSFAEYRAKLDVAMGGRVAESLIYGADNVTDGASSDISSATSMASYVPSLNSRTRKSILMLSISQRDGSTIRVLGSHWTGIALERFGYDDVASNASRHRIGNSVVDRSGTRTSEESPQ